jgi:rod shape-determining protein MreC
LSGKLFFTFKLPKNFLAHFLILIIYEPLSIARLVELSTEIGFKIPKLGFTCEPARANRNFRAEGWKNRHDLLYLNIMQTSLSRSIVPLSVVAILAAAIGVLNIPFLNSQLKNGAYSMIGPVQQYVWFAGAQVSEFIGSLANMNSAARENEQLKGRVDELLAANAQMEDLKKENDYLRQGLNLELNKDFDLKLADIIAKNVGSDTLIINKGSKDMVQAGMPVITSQKAVVGKISKVYDNFSEVELITSKNFSFDVKIGDDMIDGLVKGQGGFAATIDLVSKDKELKPGSQVVTSQMGGIFPAGLVIGTIKDVNKNDVETFQSAAISLAFDINGSSRVFIANAKYPLNLETPAPAQNKK